MFGTATGRERNSLALADVSENGLHETRGTSGRRDWESNAAHRERGRRNAGEGICGSGCGTAGRATILFNNAGVALLGHLEEISIEEFRWLMDINFWGVVYGVTYFLPLLKKEKRAHIVNTSSLLGFFGASGKERIAPANLRSVDTRNRCTTSCWGQMLASLACIRDLFALRLRNARKWAGVQGRACARKA